MIGFFRAIKRHTTNRYRGDSGQSLVEAALLFTMLLVILAGVVDLGRAFNAYIVTINAARVGARYGSMYPTDVNGIRTRVINDASGAGITLTEDNVQVNCISGPGEQARINVNVSYPIQPILGLIWGTDALTITTGVQMLIIGAESCP